MKIKMTALELIAHLAENGTTQSTLQNIAIIARETLAAVEEQKYHRGNRLLCIETEEYCVIHISGTDRQWVKFPDSHVGVYTNEQVAELFELLPKETEQEPLCTAAMFDDAFLAKSSLSPDTKLYTTPPQRKPLTDEQIFEINNGFATWMFPVETRVTDRELAFARAIEAAHGIKE